MLIIKYQPTKKAVEGYKDSSLAQSETNDCVVRAFAAAFDVSYEKSHKWVKTKFKRENRDGTYAVEYTLSKLTQKWGKKIKIIPTDYDETVIKFMKKNPKGTWIILVEGHVFCIKDEVVIGNFHDSRKLTTEIQGAFKVSA